MSAKQKDQIAAFCSAQAIVGQLATGNNDVVEAAVARLSIDWAKHWRPHAENFFARITKPRQLAIGKELACDEWVANCNAEKKGQIAERLENLAKGALNAISSICSMVLSFNFTGEYYWSMAGDLDPVNVFDISAKAFEIC